VNELSGGTWNKGGEKRNTYGVMVVIPEETALKN